MICINLMLSENIHTSRHIHKYCIIILRLHFLYTYRGESAASRMFQLHIVNSNLIPGTPYSPLTLPGVIPDCRASNKS